ncbi:VOC family protein [Dyadobacter arcticus]|uniref:Enzyme related to lactoylglutathione lyase n=1 Tax=Dyadobacter arcticus TaxID=1078754 RepID=A0ABX0ULN5_9BACT|nr:VOC family protein [Dyadobacter arcticus]NIJ53903.1 putative enzyme related to lactoylglutathione lyase [Dyadobacter arcticus]
MFKQTEAFSGFSVDNLKEAKAFYGDILGLDVTDEMEEMVLGLHLAGGHNIMIYEKPNHEPATFTILNFKVADIEKTVQELKDKGVKFESYDSPELQTDDDNISRGEGPVIAWFTDPAGNILSVIEA